MPDFFSLRVARRIRTLMLLPLILIGSLMGAAGTQSSPNIIFILCDDLGFGDIGPTFQNERAAKNDRSMPAFSTPQLDRFAREGMILRNHYSPAPVCAPSRASLLLGVHQGHANVRDNQFDKALSDTHTLGTVLQAAGYATAMVGKWGLQGQLPLDNPSLQGDLTLGNPTSWPSYPTERGFDFFHGYVRHRDGHYHYPKEDGFQIWENDREISAALDGCYSTDLFTARAKRWIVEHEAAKPEQPFFLYLAYDTPHAKLQNPPCAYPDGGGLNGGVQWDGVPGAMLNTAGGTVDGWSDPVVAEATWDDDGDANTPEVAWPDVQRRHATVVRRIDAAVGDVMQLLRDLGIEGETLVVFTSDNGPSRESYLPNQPYTPNFFNGFGPFDGIKRDTWEGGLREPTLVRWPARVASGQVVRTPSAFYDWMPTFAELAGTVPPAATDGVSLVPTLTGEGTQSPSTIYVEYFNEKRTPNFPQFAASHRGRKRGQMQMLIVDGFTGVRYDIASVDDDFEIFDVEQDPQQVNDLAQSADFDLLQMKMKQRVLQVRRPDASAPRPYDAAFMPAVEAVDIVPGRIRCDSYDGQWPWVPEFAALLPKRTDMVTGIDLSPCPPGDRWGVAFSGYLHAAEEGDYTFFADSAGGAALFLHDARVIDDDFERTGEEVSGSVRLAAGWHPLRFYVRHDTGPRRLALEYAGPSFERRPVPASALAVDEATAAAVSASKPVEEVYVYKQVDDRALKLHVVKPEHWDRNDKRPAIVFFHGGAWTGGGANQFAPHSAYLASRGMVGICVEYRLLEKGTRVPPVVCIRDAKSALRWVRAHAGELGIDPDRIAASGGSAGGHLAAFVGMVDGGDDPADDLTISAKANALVLFNPVFDNGPDDGWGYFRVGDQYRQFSPAHNISPDDPPAIVFLGTVDKLIPVAVVERFKARLAEAGVRCETSYFEGQGHAFFNYGRQGGKYFIETLKKADRFLASLGWLHGAPTLESRTSWRASIDPATP